MQFPISLQDKNLRFIDNFAGSSLGASWVKDANVTAAVTGGTCALSVPSSGGCITQSLSKYSKWSATVKITANTWDSGIRVYGTNGQQCLHIGYGWGGLYFQHWVGFSWISTATTISLSGAAWIKLTYDGLTIRCYYSTDDKAYTFVNGELASAWVGVPISVGVYCGGAPGSMSIDRFMLTQDYVPIIPPDYFFHLDPDNYNTSTLNWADDSGNVFDFTASTGTPKATVRGVTLVDFSSNRYATKTSGAQTITQFTAVVVGKFMALGSSARPFSMQAGTGYDWTAPRSLPMTFGTAISTSKFYSLPPDGHVEAAESPNVSEGELNILATTWNSNGNITNYVNNQAGTTYANAAGWTRNIDHWGIGLTVGNTGDATGKWNNLIGDVYFWKRVLTSDELTAVYKVLKAKYRIENTQLGDWNLGPAGMQIPLPSGVQLQLDVPLTDASTNPPVNLSTPGSRTATKVGSPTLQSSVIRPGKTYVGYAPGTPGAATTGEWSWTRAAWNTLTAKNFAIEAWINIPTLASADGSVQHLCGAGAPNTMGTSFGLYKTAGQWYMLCNSYYGQLAVGGITITNGTWHHIAMTYTHSGTTTNLYFDGILVGSGTALAATDYGSPTTFYLGGHDNNGIYTNALAGYISNFRLYT